MRSIPECRRTLLCLASALRTRNGVNFSQVAADIEAIVEDMKRRPMVRRAAVRQVLTDAKILEVKRYAEGFPDMSYFEIGRALDVNPGRVSEIVAGRRNASPV